MTVPILRLTLPIALVIVTAPAMAQNLVLNPGFESGTLAPFVVTGNGSGVSEALNGHVLVAHNGTHAASFASQGSPGGIEQALATTPGTAYTVSFWLRFGEGQASSTDSFVSSFGGGSLAFSALPMTYALFSFTGVATSTSTTLDFSGRSDGGSYLLDDIFVTPVPEPATWAALGIASTFLVVRRRANVTIR